MGGRGGGGGWARRSHFPGSLESNRHMAVLCKCIQGIHATLAVEISKYFVLKHETVLKIADIRSKFAHTKMVNRHKLMQK